MFQEAGEIKAIKGWSDGLPERCAPVGWNRFVVPFRAEANRGQPAERRLHLTH